MSQEVINNLVSKYGFPPNVEVWLPHPGEKANTSDEY